MRPIKGEILKTLSEREVVVIDVNEQKKIFTGCLRLLSGKKHFIINEWSFDGVNLSGFSNLDIKSERNLEYGFERGNGVQNNERI